MRTWINLSDIILKLSKAQLLVVTLLMQFLAINAASCDLADYKNLVGSSLTMSSGLLVAPNSKQDLLIAGGYTEYVDSVDRQDSYIFVYLFRESSCSYEWRFST